MGNQIGSSRLEQIQDADSDEVNDLLNLVAQEVDHQYNSNNNLPPNLPGNPYFTCNRQIGQGVSSRVYLSTNVQSQRRYALKELQRTDGLQNKMLFKNERTMLNKLNHPNIISCKQSFINRNAFYLAMEYCSGGTVMQKLQKHGAFSEHTSVSIIKSLLNAIHYMHKRNIVHRDLKCSNIVFDKHGNNTDIKLIDFGNAELIKCPSYKDHIRVGTCHYLSPEILSDNRIKEDLLKADLWSIGVICFVMVTGKFPFNGRDKEEVYSKILKGTIEWPKHIDLSKQCKSFIVSLLNVNAKKRMSAGQALNHSWMTANELKDTKPFEMNEYNDFDRLFDQI